MKNIFLLFFVSFLIFFCSCKEDIEIKMENTTGILCLNGYMYSECDTNLLYVTLTGVSKPKNVNNADIKVFVNGTLTEEKTESEQGLDGRYILKTKFKPGDLVRIEAAYNGQKAWRETEVPAYPKDFNATITPEKNKSYYDVEMEEYKHSDMYRIDISFNDVSNQKNYYRLNLDYISYSIRSNSQHEIIEKTVEIDGDEYVVYKDTVYYQRDTAYSKGYEDLTYISEAPPLCDEEMTTDNDFMDATYNYYKVFNNSRFVGGKCDLRIYKKTDYQFPPETANVYDQEDVERLPQYFYTQYVGVESIDEQAYYFMKSLNGYESGTFDSQELTGAMKMWRNVSGGSGNIVFVSRVMKKIVVYDDYKPTPIFIERDDNGYYDY